MCRADTVVPNGFTANGARGSFFARTANRYLFVEEVDWAEDARVRRSYEPGAKVRCSQASIRQLRSCAGRSHCIVHVLLCREIGDESRPLQRYLSKAWRKPDVLPALKLKSFQRGRNRRRQSVWEQVVIFSRSNDGRCRDHMRSGAKRTYYLRGPSHRGGDETLHRECRVEPDMGRSCSTRIPDQ